MQEQAASAVADEAHTRERVPDSEAVPGFQVGLVCVGIAITLPSLYTGGEIARGLGLGEGSVAVLVATPLEKEELPLSVLVAVTVRSKLAELSAGGVIARSDNWSEVSVAVPLDTVTVSPPAVRTAPSGMPEISTLRVSDPSVSVSAEVISNAIAASSSPLAA